MTTAGAWVKRALHFIGFRGNEYHSAVRIWGKPDFIHPAWDRWARQDMHPVDTVIFAKGTEVEPAARFNRPLSALDHPISIRKKTGLQAGHGGT